MEEAVSSYVPPSQLQFLFACIIIERYPAWLSWDTFSEALATDFIQSLHSTEYSINCTLQQIAEYIKDGSWSLEQYGLPQPWLQSPEVTSEIEAFENWLEMLHMQACKEQMIMNPEQQHMFRSVYSDITDANDNKIACQPLFIEGCPGRGKMYIMDVIVKLLHSKGKIVLTIGTSALAASLHEQGPTAHNLFNIPVTEVCTMVSIQILIDLSPKDNTDLCSKIHPETYQANWVQMLLPLYGRNYPVQTML